MVKNSFKFCKAKQPALHHAAQPISTEIKRLQAEWKTGALRKQDLQADVSKARDMLHKAKDSQRS